MRDSFVFYKSFYEAVAKLPAEYHCECYDLIFRYVFYGEEPMDDGIAAAMFTAFKPVIDTNNARYEGGKKGGRPKKETLEKPSDNLEETLVKPCDNHEVTSGEPNVYVHEDVYEDVSEDVSGSDDIKTSCMPEPEADVDPVILNDGSEWRPSVYLYEKYASTYTGIDVAAEFRKMSTWTLSNPQKRKTKRGVTRFVNSWLDRAQSKGRSPTYTEAIANRMSVVDQWLEESG